MKIALQIFMVLMPFLFFSCIGNNKIQANTNSLEQVIGENRTTKLVKYNKLDNESEYDIYFKIEKNGVYTIDEKFSLEYIINGITYGNNTLERTYDDLLFFINTNKYTWSLYNYKTKDYREIPWGVDLIKYISEDKVNITTKDDVIVLNFTHDEEIGKIMKFSYSGETGTEEIDLFYYSMMENINQDDKNIHKVKLFDKNIFIDTFDYIELSYYKRHNIFILCVYSSKGRPEFKQQVQRRPDKVF
jgi:hypothetical protein